MEKIQTFEIVFSTVEETYYAGQTVEGYCVLELYDTLSMKGIRAHFLGQATVKWTESRKARHDREARELHYITHIQTQPYFSNQLQLLQPASGGLDSLSLPAGRHTFPFSFSLPHDLPSTFDGKYGTVEYSVVVVIARPRGQDCKVKSTFTVIGLVDLNLDPSNQNTAEAHDKKMICCLCCASGPISAILTLHRLGHIIGEPLQFTVTVSNNSSREIESCYISLVMLATFFANGKSKQDSSKVALVATDSIEPRKHMTWTGEQLQLMVPRNCPPSHLPGCELMDVEYVFKVSVLPTAAFELTVSLPITIGTLPLHNAETGHPPVPSTPLCMTLREGYSTLIPPVGASSSLNTSSSLCDTKAKLAGASDNSFEGARGRVSKTGGASAPPAAMAVGAWGVSDTASSSGHGTAVTQQPMRLEPSRGVGESPPSYEECIQELKITGVRDNKQEETELQVFNNQF